nr:hypothetical protein [Tanacetum cinerariifolium]
VRGWNEVYDGLTSAHMIIDLLNMRFCKDLNMALKTTNQDKDVFQKQSLFTEGNFIDLMKAQISNQYARRSDIYWNTLHKHYQKYPTKEEATTHPPDGIMVADWVVLYEKVRERRFPENTHYK